MGILQEAAIFAGDFVTQPIQAKIREIITGKPMCVKKNVMEGALMGDGSFNPDIKSEYDAAMLTVKTRKTVYVASFHEKRVSWEIVEKQS